MPDLRIPKRLLTRIKKEPEKKDHNLSLQKIGEILLSEALNLRDNQRQCMVRRAVEKLTT